jgi:hypothetical protein
LGEGVHRRLHITCFVGSFACPGIDTRVHGILVQHLIQRTWQSK